MAQPNFIPEPFAVNGDKNTIPESTTAGAASWQLGFPPITALPLGAGGVAPDRKDFNAVLYALSASAVFSQAGGIWTYSDSINYEPPALIYSDVDDTFYICVAANGPDSTVMAPSSDLTGEYWQPVPLGEIQWVNQAIPTRTGNTTITLTGDQRTAFPIGKRLRFNGSNSYLCRVYGNPSYSGGQTTINVWFDVSSTVVPSSITQFEASALMPQDTAHGGGLITSTLASGTITLLIQSFCFGSVLLTGTSGSAVYYASDGNGNVISQTLVAASEVGTLKYFAGSTPPANTLACDGSAVSRTTYPELFAAIGTTWGAGDGSTTFNLPDFTSVGAFLRSTGGNAAALGTEQGDAIRKITGRLSFITTNYESSDGQRGCLVVPPSSETNIFYQGQLSDSYSGHGLTDAYDSGSIYPYQHIMLDVSRNVPTATENRPVNYSVNICIVFE